MAANDELPRGWVRHATTSTPGVRAGAGGSAIVGVAQVIAQVDWIVDVSATGSANTFSLWLWQGNTNLVEIAHIVLPAGTATASGTWTGKFIGRINESVSALFLEVVPIAGVTQLVTVQGYAL